jgi:hypothetical protein
MMLWNSLLAFTRLRDATLLCCRDGHLQLALFLFEMLEPLLLIAAHPAVLLPLRLDSVPAQSQRATSAAVRPLAICFNAR